MPRWDKWLFIEIELLILIMASIGLFAYGYAKHAERKRIAEITEIGRGAKSVAEEVGVSEEGTLVQSGMEEEVIPHVDVSGRIIEKASGLPAPEAVAVSSEALDSPAISESPEKTTQGSLASPPQTPDVEAQKPLVPQAELPGYMWHRNITATVFWVGEPVGNGSSEDNALSCWDDHWLDRYGGYDDPFCRNGYYPCDFMPLDQNFYVSEPYNDFDGNGNRKASAQQVVPWANEQDWEGKSMMKGQWVEIQHSPNTCYAQVNDCGPYEYDDYEYVFGLNGKENTPINKLANSAGMDVSPAVRDCLNFEGENNADNKINWRFVDASEVPEGPWKERVTTNELGW